MLVVFPLLIGLLYSQNTLGIGRYQSAVSTAWETAPTYLNSRYNFYEFNHDALAKDTEQKDDRKGGFKIGVGTGFTVYTGEYMSEATSAPSIDIFVRIPYTLYLGPLNVSVGAELQTYSFTEGLGADISGIGLMGVANFDITETVYVHVGAGYLGNSLGITAGAKFDYPIPNVGVPSVDGKLSATAFLKANATLDGGLEESGDQTSSTGWANFGIALSYGRPSSRSSKSKRVSGGGEYLTVLDIISPELKKNLDIATKTLGETLGEQHPITIKVSSMLDSIEAKVRITDNGGIVEYSKIGNPSYDDFFITAARLDGMAIIGKSMITHSIKQLKYFAMSKASDEALQLNIKLLVGDTPPEEWSDEQAISVLRMANEKRKVTSDEKKYFLATAGLIGIAVLSLGEAIDEAKELIPKGEQLMKNTKSLKYTQIPKATKGIKNSLENLNSVVNNAPKMLEEMKVLLDALKSLS
jgi:hypothetical protein